MSNPNSSIKAFYLKEYPSDSLGQEVSDITFYYLFQLLDARADVYPYLADDSIVRERIFQELANVMGVDYEYVYEQWLMGGQS